MIQWFSVNKLIVVNGLCLSKPLQPFSIGFQPMNFNELDVSNTDLLVFNTVTFPGRLITRGSTEVARVTYI